MHNSSLFCQYSPSHSLAVPYRNENCTERERVLLKMNSMHLPLHASLPETLGFFIQESFATSIVMSLRCDNTAAISMLEEPGWRTRCISIYAEAIRQEMQQRTLTLTYVSTEHQLADPLTKPTTALVNLIIFSQWGLVRFLSLRLLKHLFCLFAVLPLWGSLLPPTSWLDTCHCATWLAIVVSLQLCHLCFILAYW